MLYAIYRTYQKKNLSYYAVENPRTPQPLPYMGGEWLRKVQAKETTAQVEKFDFPCRPSSYTFPAKQAKTSAIEAAYVGKV